TGEQQLFIITSDQGEEPGLVSSTSSFPTVVVNQAYCEKFSKMNRFRTKKVKNEKVVTEGAVRPSTDSDVSSIPPMKTSKSWGRSKKSQEPEPKVELDLSNALPSSDDFRTSLLMNGLSARFSMLREQDDPSSKIGKASDDSVLFSSNRQSRLNDFGYTSRGGLSDIAEVSSIKGSIRPPFAAYDRKDSSSTLNDGYGTDDDSANGGSIMSRAKPGEGNNFFGGRQKIYKIAADGGSSKGGRVLYEDDVSQSAFQKIREREKEEARLKQQQLEDEQEEAEQLAQASRPNSPLLTGYNRNRETSSTTSSGPNTRISTAATSLMSQRTPSLSSGHNAGASTTSAGLDRSGTKSRRLYETGLDKDLHEQQFSAMSRIDTLSRQRTFGAHTPPPGRDSPTGASGGSGGTERQQVATQMSMPNLRAASPPPISAASGKFDFGVKPATAEAKPSYGFVNPPLSPPMSEDDHGVLAVQPNDKGKATALMSFSKPNMPYDENKYSLRQLQMQQGRETPPPRRNSPPRAFAPRYQAPGTMAPAAPRNRADSNITFGSSRSVSNGSASAQRSFRIEDRLGPPALKNDTTVPEDDEMASSGTFLASPDSPESSIDAEPPSKPWDRAGAQSPAIPKGYRPDPNQSPVLERPPESQHPAHRPDTHLSQDESPVIEQRLSTPTINRLSTGDLSKQHPKSSNPDDSPTLGPTTGLSGMVRQHLRSDSNNSSIYGGTSLAATSAGVTSRFPEDPTEPMPRLDYHNTKSNPWDLDDWEQKYYGDANTSADVKPLTGQVEAPPPLSVRPTNVETAPQDNTWEQELASHHTRIASTDTQIERQELADDLATRRRQVQEKMKSFVEGDNKDNGRAASPLPGMEWARQNNPLGLLKAKTSRTSLVVKTQREKEQPSKAMKMLGIGNATMTTSPSPSRKVFDDNSWKQEEEEMLRGVPKANTTLGPQTKAFRQARRDAQRSREQQVMMRHQPNQREGGGEHDNREWHGPRPIQTRPGPGSMYRQRDPSRERGPGPMNAGPGPMHAGQRVRTPSRDKYPPPVSHNPHRLNGNSRESHESGSSGSSGSRQPSRDRSSSDASGRSKSRYRDDIARAMADGIGSSGQGPYESAPVSARLMPKSPGMSGLAFQPSPSYERSPGFQPSPSFPVSPLPPSPAPGSIAVSRARSRSNSKSGYFDQTLNPTQASDNVDIGLPRPSPVAPFVVNPTPPVASPATTPVVAPPTTTSFQSSGRALTTRKKSINKSEISEPTFLSSTSRITTVALPSGSSLSNGSEPSPPIPPINPRRRQTRVQTMFGAFAGRKEDPAPAMSLQQATQSTDEMSTFSADEADTKGPRQRQRLRKSSSEGGNMNARARQQAMAMPSPAVPPTPTANRAASPPRMEGGMF
ncbi:hypothetical protein PVAG01_01275, partial [Phlyctema vagabunda]